MRLAETLLKLKSKGGYNLNKIIADSYDLKLGENNNMATGIILSINDKPFSITAESLIEDLGLSLEDDILSVMFKADCDYIRLGHYNLDIDTDDFLFRISINVCSEISEDNRIILLDLNTTEIRGNRRFNTYE